MAQQNRMLAVAGVLFGLCGAQMVVGQTFTMPQALDYPFPSQLTAAAQGERVAWVVKDRGASNVWVADGPTFAARQVTHYQGDDGMPIASLRLTPDGKTAVYVRGSETNGAGEVADPTNSVVRPQQEVWTAAVDGEGEPQRLGAMNCSPEGCEDIQISPNGKWAVWSARSTLWLAPVSGAEPVRALAYVRGNNTDPQWSPDSQAVAFASGRGTHSLIAIYRLGSPRIEYVAPSVFRDEMPRWSPDGSELAFVRLAGGGTRDLMGGGSQPWAIWTWTAASGKAREVWHNPAGAHGAMPGEWESVAFNFAAGRVVFAAQLDGWVHLYSVPANGGTALLLTPGAFSIAPAAVTLADAGKTLLYSSNQGDSERRHVWSVGVDQPGPKALSSGHSIEWTPVQTGDGKVVVCLGADATHPGAPFRLEGGQRVAFAGAGASAAFPSAAMVEPQGVVFHSADGLEVHGQLFVPRDHSGKHPALIFTHGGPPRQMMLGFHPMDAYNYMYAANQYFANHGYVVLSVNYRLGIMYGEAFRTPKAAGPQGGSEYQDVVAGAKYLQALPYVDANRVGLWGGSYGGYLTAMGLARNSDIFKAGVDYAGVHDWRMMMAGAGAAARQTAYEASPVATINKWTSPVLLIQGDDDRNVRFQQTVDLARLLRQHHIPHEVLVFPDGIHDSLLWSAWLKNFEATAEFLDRKLK